MATVNPPYRPCPHCASQMALVRGLYLCADSTRCGYTEPLEPTAASSPEYRSLLRARRRAVHGPRLSY